MNHVKALKHYKNEKSLVLRSTTRPILLLSLVVLFLSL